MDLSCLLIAFMALCLAIDARSLVVKLKKRVDVLEEQNKADKSE